MLVLAVPVSLASAFSGAGFYLGAKIGWPDVGLALIAALPGLVAAIFAGLNHMNMKTPSGAKIGIVAERAHDLAAAAAFRADRILNGDAEPPHGAPATPEQPASPPSTPPPPGGTPPAA